MLFYFSRTVSLALQNGNMLQSRFVSARRVGDQFYRLVGIRQPGGRGELFVNNSKPRTEQFQAIPSAIPSIPESLGADQKDRGLLDRLPRFEDRFEDRFESIFPT